MILTSRLALRGWETRDREPYHAIKRDPVVMATLGPPQTRAESDATLDRLIASEAQHGHTFWAMERRPDGLLLGYAGLLHGPDHTPIAGELEIGWGLGSAHWGRGYAREAAEAVLAWAWANTPAGQIVAITTPGNLRSWGLMERLGMRRDPAGDFLHPRLAEGDPLRPHITYRIVRPG
jgi:RimJ/RimL family protein N-acetyltransferase